MSGQGDEVSRDDETRYRETRDYQTRDGDKGQKGYETEGGYGDMRQDKRTGIAAGAILGGGQEAARGVVRWDKRHSSSDLGELRSPSEVEAWVCTRKPSRAHRPGDLSGSRSEM
jgi:hypothetical protein